MTFMTAHNEAQLRRHYIGTGVRSLMKNAHKNGL
jgi:hypothetical protein